LSKHINRTNYHNLYKIVYIYSCYQTVLMGKIFLLTIINTGKLKKKQ